MGKKALKLAQNSQQTGSRYKSHGISHHWQTKPLMSPDELMRLPEKQGIVLLEGQYPIQIEKLPWYYHLDS